MNKATTARTARTAAAKLTGRGRRAVPAEMTGTEAVSAPVTVKITDLTASNVSALRKFVPSAELAELGATFAVFNGDAQHAVHIVTVARDAAAEAQGSRRGGAFQSLHAPLRKLQAVKSGPKAEAKPAAAAKPAAPAKANGKDAPRPAGLVKIDESVARSAKAAQTNAEAKASGETRKCEGACGKTLAITSFPTTGRNATTGVMGRGKVCRADRDAARAAAKSGK